jgi:hypothetical protein
MRFALFFFHEPIGIVYEPFEFRREARRAGCLEICPGVSAKVVTLKTLLEMKRAAGRPQDLIDIEELQRIQ